MSLYTGGNISMIAADVGNANNSWIKQLLRYALYLGLSWSYTWAKFDFSQNIKSVTNNVLFEI